MAHIVFAAPGIPAFHFHDRLGRELTRRGHSIEAVFFDRVAATFWAAQGEPVTSIDDGTPEAPSPHELEEFVADECRRLARPRGGLFARRLRKRLARLLPATLRHLAAAEPDLVLLHGERSAERRVLHFAARLLGMRTLWTAPGLLPHTLQVDPLGIDGDASAARRDAFAYRDVKPDVALLRSVLAHLLAHPAPFALSRRETHRPALRQRVACALAAARRGRFADLPRCLFGPRGMPGTSPRRAVPHASPPERPFLVVLLQDPADERVRLDDPDPPSPTRLLEAAADAARALDPELELVAVLPSDGHGRRGLLRRVERVGASALPPTLAAEAATSAVAVMTIDHPFGIAALLAGTPVLHTGRALYELGGVTWKVPAERFAEVLPEAASADRNPHLRARQLTHLLRHDHLWCSPTEPDHNGLLGLSQRIGLALGEPRPDGLGNRYRNGPAWPLSAERTWPGD